MKKNLILLGILIVLYLITGFSLSFIYGDSFTFLSGENYWEPDGNGGWQEYGNPDIPMPTEKSVMPPLISYYLPMFIPAFVLFLFLFTPLGRLIEEKNEDEFIDESDPTLKNDSDH